MDAFLCKAQLSALYLTEMVVLPDRRSHSKGYGSLAWIEKHRQQSKHNYNTGIISLLENRYSCSEGLQEWGGMFIYSYRPGSIYSKSSTAGVKVSIARRHSRRDWHIPFR